jgi:2-polyprenyl-3-methyl-5-hydroxy-6-metoxy-1,4-benzoquinol methylase
MKDLFGKAILDFQTNNSPEDLIIETSISEEDVMPISYLFRSFAEMPIIERRAMELVKGKVLDVGCGAGCHSIYLKQEKNLDVTSIDISENAIKTCQLRGLKKAYMKDLLEIENETFDTIILLMNGTGIFGKYKNAIEYLTKLKTLLKPNGQILIDSSDLIYMFDEDQDKEKWIPNIRNYYGEIIFNLTYKKEKEKPFTWLYLDFNTLQNTAKISGLQCEIIIEGTNYDYLARLF